MTSLDEHAKVNSFEQYRRELRGVQILTFDELKLRAEGILGLLSSGVAVPVDGETDVGDGAIPF